MINSLHKRESFTETGTYANFSTPIGRVYVIAARLGVTIGSVTVNVPGSTLRASALNKVQNGALISVAEFLSTSGEAQSAYWPTPGLVNVGTGYFEVITADSFEEAVNYAHSLFAPVPTPAPAPAPNPAPAGLTDEQYRTAVLEELREQNELIQARIGWSDKQHLMSECVLAAYAKDSDIDDLPAKAQQLYDVALAKIESVRGQS